MINLPYANAQEQVNIKRRDGTAVPIRLFRPEHYSNNAPIALISPGAGGTENGMRYLAEALCKNGWIAIVVGHKESGPVTLRKDVRKFGFHEGLLKMTTNPILYKDRFMDIDATLQWVGKQDNPPFSVLIGHSMGAATVMLEAGAQNKLGLHGENQFDAYVALSPQGPGSIFPNHAWKDIHKPVLILTGTRDYALNGGWKFRTIPYQEMSDGCKWLGVIKGASHLNFAGIGLGRRKTEMLTIRYVLAFLNDLTNGKCGKPPAINGVIKASK